MKREISLLFSIGFLLIMLSCGKKEDSDNPEITFIDPVAGYVVNMPDTLDVRVEISDDRIISSVVLSLVDENKVPVIPAEYYYPNSPEFSIQASLPIIDKALESGNYQLLVTATDGINSKDKYREIQINGLPAEIMAYIVVTAQFDFKSTIIKLNPDFETDTQFVFPKGYCLSGVHSLWEQFYFVSVEPSDLFAFDPANFETEWEMETFPPRPLFTGLFPDKELVFSTANGDAGILSGSGTVILRTAPLDDKMIKHITADDKYIYAAHVSLSGEIHQLTVYYRVSGSIRDQKMLSGEISGLVPAGNGALVFFSSAPGTGIMEYDPENLSMEQLNFLQNENLRSVEKVSDSQLFLVTDNRVIVYDPGINLFTNFTDQPYDFCRYDHLYDIIYLAKGNLVYGFHRTTGDLIEDLSFPEEVLDFQILYNK